MSSITPYRYNLWVQETDNEKKETKPESTVYTVKNYLFYQKSPHFDYFIRKVEKWKQIFAMFM